MYRGRENWGSSIHLEIFICLENIINKFDRLSHNFMGKKEARMSDSRYKASNVDAKKFTSVLCNIIDLLMILTFK